MKAESLEELKAAVDDWRIKKQHPQEALPEDLLDRARRAIPVHGLGGVIQATRIDRARLRGRSKNPRKKQKATAATPSFTRLERTSSSTANHHPFAELETPAGLKIRIFIETPEILCFLASLCGAVGGGTR
jgi:hypothetical protein